MPEAGLSASDSGDRVLRLGKERHQYVVLSDITHAHNIFAYVYQAAQDANLSWPASEVEVEPFAEALKAFTLSIRSYRDEQGFGLRRAGDPLLYTVKHFLRFVLFQLGRMNLQMQDIPWSKLAQWLPDNHDLCAPFNGKSVARVEGLVGLHAPRIPMFTCLACKLQTLNLTPQQWRQLFKLADGDIMKCLRKHEYDCKTISVDHYWPPGPKELVQLLLKDGYL